MLFKDVIGQEEAKQRLIAEVKEGRIPHAQLICGPVRVRYKISSSPSTS